MLSAWINEIIGPPAYVPRRILGIPPGVCGAVDVERTTGVLRASSLQHEGSPLPGGRYRRLYLVLNRDRTFSLRPGITVADARLVYDDGSWFRKRLDWIIGPRDVRRMREYGFRSGVIAVFDIDQRTALPVCDLAYLTIAGLLYARANHYPDVPVIRLSFAIRDEDGRWLVTSSLPSGHDKASP